MVVASVVDGRVRIRDDGLKREPLLTRVREALLTTQGVSEVEGNRRVGSLLVIYSAALTAVEKILKTVSDLLSSGEETSETGEPEQTAGGIPLIGRVSLSIPRRVQKKLMNGGLLASLALTLIAAAFYLKKLHIAAGIIFAALAAGHVYQRRTQLFA